MNERSLLSRPSLFQRLVLLAARLYLLFMIVYMVLRFTVQDGLWVISLLNTFALLLFLPLPFLFVLALAARSRLALVSLVPVIALALVWFAPRLLPKSVAPAEPPIIRVLTNNVWRLNATPEALTALIEAADPDVIFLQEVQQVIHDGALAALEAEYPYQTAVIDQIRLNMYTASNITLSRFPFVVSEEVELELPNIPTIYRNVIEVDGRRVALYNIHLNAPFEGEPRIDVGQNYIAQVFFGFDDSERNHQIDVLLAHLAAEPYPYMVAGDFNTSDTSMSYQRMRSQMHDSFGAVGYGLGATWPMVDALGWASIIPPLLRLDYVWHSDGLRAVSAWQGTYVGSDHLPVLADIVLD